MNFTGSTQPHYWCYGCQTLWVEEMDYLLRCTNARHLSNVGFRRRTA
jgi:hypothetical protein